MVFVVQFFGGIDYFFGVFEFFDCFVDYCWFGLDVGVVGNWFEYQVIGGDGQQVGWDWLWYFEGVIIVMCGFGIVVGVYQYYYVWV